MKVKYIMISEEAYGNKRRMHKIDLLYLENPP